MKEEILAAVAFFIRFIEKSDKFPQDQIENFKQHLTELLIQRFEKHWFPELPTRGQGYRCIRVNGISPVDLTLERAASKCGSSYRDLRLPTELTVWVDPSEVCYRLGESEGSYCTLASFRSDLSSSETSSPTNSPPSTPMQDKYRRLHQPMTQQKYLSDFSTKFRNPANMLTSLRFKKDVNATFVANRSPLYRHDTLYVNPALYKPMGINRPNYKNVVRV